MPVASPAAMARKISVISREVPGTERKRIRLNAPNTATPAPSSGYTTLQESSCKSDAAKKLQARLIELGYLDDKADGYFGAKTTEAVKKFQTAIGMTADGIATAAVQEALFASDAPAASAPAEGGEN